MVWFRLRQAVYHGPTSSLLVFGAIVPFVFWYHCGLMMNDLRLVERDDLIFDVDRALEKAAHLWPRKRGPGDHNPYRMVATAVVKHLELCGLRLFRGPPDRWRGGGMPPGG